MNEIGKYGVASIYWRQINAFACTEFTFNPQTFHISQTIPSFAFNSSNRLLLVTCSTNIYSSLEPNDGDCANDRHFYFFAFFYFRNWFICSAWRRGQDGTIETLHIGVAIFETNKHTHTHWSTAAPVLHAMAIDNLVVGRWCPKFTLTIFKHFSAIRRHSRTSFSITVNWQCTLSE